VRENHESGGGRERKGQNYWKSLLSVTARDRQKKRFNERGVNQKTSRVRDGGKKRLLSDVYSEVGKGHGSN